MALNGGSVSGRIAVLDALRNALGCFKEHVEGLDFMDTVPYTYAIDQGKGDIVAQRIRSLKE